MELAGVLVDLLVIFRRNYFFHVLNCLLLDKRLLGESLELTDFLVPKDCLKTSEQEGCRIPAYTVL